MRRFPYLIAPVDPPKHPIPAGATHMEALVFSLHPHPPEKVLIDYCIPMGLDPARFTCKAVVFSKDMRAGKGWLFVRKEGDGFQMGVDSRDGGKVGD